MRKALVELCLLLLAITGIHTLKIMQNGSINGKVYPAGIVKSVVAVNGTDSVITMSENGNFALIVKPGVWKVIFAVNKQTRNVIRENVQVTEGKNINLGEIRLSE